MPDPNNPLSYKLCLCSALLTELLYFENSSYTSRLNASMGCRLPAQHHHCDILSTSLLKSAMQPASTKKNMEERIKNKRRMLKKKKKKMMEMTKKTKEKEKEAKKEEKQEEEEEEVHLVPQ